MNKKYEFTGETLDFEGVTLHRIRALRDIGKFIKKGDLGGWIEDERNLMCEGASWVSDEAKSFGLAMLCGTAILSCNSIARDGIICRDYLEVEALLNNRELKNEEKI